MSDNDKKRFFVRIPITGHVTAEVEADDEESAIDKAMELTFSTKDIEEWDVSRYIVRGNVFYGTIRQAEAEEV